MHKKKNFLKEVHKSKLSKQVCFDRKELNQIMSIYSRYVIAGEWCDYAIDFGRVEAVFSIFGKRSVVPAYKIVKKGNGIRKYRLVDPAGKIVLMAEELKQVVNGIGRNYIKLI